MKNDSANKAANNILTNATFSPYDVMISFLNSVFPVEGLSASGSFFYREFGPLVFVLNCAFLLFSGITCALADFNKDRYDDEGELS